MLHRHSAMIAIITICSFLLISATPAHADDVIEEVVPTGGKSVLEITPVTKRLALNADETHDSTMKVTNTGSEEVTVHIYAKPFSTSEDGETQNFDTETTYTQIARWITIKTESGAYEPEAVYSIPPQEAKTIDYKISTPEEVPGGGQYAVLFVEAEPPEGNTKNVIQTISRVGMTIYATMPGEPKRAVHIEGINVGSLILNQAISTQTRIKNEGNIDFQASIDIKISSIFGKQLYANTVISSIFPESIKTIYAGWDDSPKFGVYRVEYSISALDISASGSHFVLVLTPTTLILAISLIILAIISIIYLAKRKVAANNENAPTICIG